MQASSLCLQGGRASACKLLQCSNSHHLSHYSGSPPAASTVQLRHHKPRPSLCHTLLTSAACCSTGNGSHTSNLESLELPAYVGKRRPTLGIQAIKYRFHGLTPHRQCQSRLVPPVQAAKSMVLSTNAGSRDDDVADMGPSIGPAFAATLSMLEWERLCLQVAEFASTHVGKNTCKHLIVSDDEGESRRLLEQTRAMTVLEFEWSTTLDFGGIQTSDAESGIRRASKGGMLSAQQLKAVVSVFQGADKLRKQVQVSARINDVTGGDSPIALLLASVSRIRQQVSFIRDPRPVSKLEANQHPASIAQITVAIDEEMRIVDTASEVLRLARARVAALSGRLAGLLRGHAGEVSERAGRMCIAVPAGVKAPTNAILLGQAAGGSVMYMEPSAAVPLNNELMAARGEAAAAEEAVLWSLTGKLLGVLEEAQIAFETVAFLDTLAARARYGVWVNGVLPELVTWDKVFHARGSNAQRRRARTESDMDAQALDGEVSASAATSVDPDERYTVRLRSLRHPLMWGEYLKQKAGLERAARMAGASSSSRIATGTARRPSAKAFSRREARMAEAGLLPPGTGQHTGSIPEAQAALSALQAPRPLDILIRPDTSVVVITGPNTGGKTATMKALGLAACMAKCGLPIPAEAPARIPCFSAVLADIGDEQSLTANLSTFSGHLRRIQGLRAEADGRALLLLDELGTGTDPTEGAALGVALLRRLVNGGLGGGALTIATTHHSVMTGLKFDDSRFENVSVEFDDAALAPTYKLLWGVPGRSNALNIAQRLGLDPELVAAARARLDTSVTSVNTSIEALEALRRELEQEEMGTWAVEQDVKRLRQRLLAKQHAVFDLQNQLAEARANALLQIYVEARQLLKEVSILRAKAGKGFPTAVPTVQTTASASNTVAAPTPPNAVSSAAVWDAWHIASSEDDESGGTRPRGSTRTSSKDMFGMTDRTHSGNSISKPAKADPLAPFLGLEDPNSLDDLFSVMDDLTNREQEAKQRRDELAAAKLAAMAEREEKYARALQAVEEEAAREADKAAHVAKAAAQATCRARGAAAAAAAASAAAATAEDEAEYGAMMDAAEGVLQAALWAAADKREQKEAVRAAAAATAPPIAAAGNAKGQRVVPRQEQKGVLQDVLDGADVEELEQLLEMDSWGSVTAASKQSQGSSLVTRRTAGGELSSDEPGSGRSVVPPTRKQSQSTKSTRQTQHIAVAQAFDNTDRSSDDMDLASIEAALRDWDGQALVKNPSHSGRSRRQ